MPVKKLNANECREAIKALLMAVMQKLNELDKKKPEIQVRQLDYL